MASLAYDVAARVHVAVHGEDNPTDREWQAYLANIGARLAEVDAIFSSTRGGGPDRAQRMYAVDFWKEKPKQPRIAVVTPSMLVVRMAGALRWFMPTQIKAFGVRDVVGAFHYLELDANQQLGVTNLVAALERRLGLAPRVSVD
jgi:hypothetical protein